MQAVAEERRAVKVTVKVENFIVDVGCGRVESCGRVERRCGSWRWRRSRCYKEARLRIGHPSFHISPRYQLSESFLDSNTSSDASIPEVLLITLTAFVYLRPVTAGHTSKLRSLPLLQFIKRRMLLILPLIGIRRQPAYHAYPTAVTAVLGVTVDEQSPLKLFSSPRSPNLTTILSAGLRF